MTELRCSYLQRKHRSWKKQIKVPGNLKYSQALKNFLVYEKNILTIRTEYDIINAVSQDVLLAKLKKRKKV